MSSPSEARLDEVLAAYLDATGRGKAPSREQWMAQHPDLAERLARFLDNQQWLRDQATTAAPAAPERVRYVGDYEILGEIARGGMGVVYRARQVSLNRPVALKMILSGALADDDQRRRFRAEAEAAANLDHPNIVPVYEVGEHGGLPYFSMKLIEGPSLAQRIDAFRGRPREAAALIAAAARAVYHAHQRGVLHRDLKPGNILLDAAGVPHVADFGLGRRLEEAGRSATGVVGTPAYMAPEQARAQKGLTVAADVWSLGVILYELLAGRLPFLGDSVLEVLEAVVTREPQPLPGDLGVIALKCLRKEPGRRYESAASLADDLDRYLRGEPILARPATPLERACRWCRRNPAVAALSAAVLLLMAGVAVGSAWLAWREMQVTRSERDLRKQAEEALEAKDEALEAKDEALSHADGLRLSAQSTALLPENPTLALLLAVEGAVRGRPRTATHNNALQAALDAVTPHRILRGRDKDAWLSDRVRISPDGRRVLSIRWMRHGPAWIWDLDRDAEPVVLQVPRYLSDDQGPVGGRFGIAEAEFSPDGTRVVTLFEGGRLCRYRDGKTRLFTERAARVWDAATGKELAVLRGHKDVVRSARFSPDGRRVVTASADGTLRVWDAADGRELAKLTGGKAHPRLAAFNPDGTRVVACGDGESVSRCTLRTADDAGEPTADETDPLFPTDRPDESSRPTWSVKQSTSFPRLMNVELRVWEPDTGRVSERSLPTKGNTTPAPAVLFPPFGNPILVFPYRNAASASWGVDAITGAPVDRLNLPDRIVDHLVHPIAFSPDGRLAALACGATVVVWDVERGREFAELKGHESREVEHAAFSADGTRLVTSVSSGDGIRVWSLPVARPGQAIRSFIGSDFAQWHPPTGKVVTVTAVWDGIRGRRLVNLSSPDRAQRSQVVIGPDGNRVLACLSRVEGVGAGADPRWARLYDANTGKELFGLRGLPGGVMHAEFSPDGTRLLTESGGGTTNTRNGVAEFDRMGKPGNVEPAVRVWDAATGSLLHTTSPPKGQSIHAAWGPEGRLCTWAGADRDWKATVREAATGAAVAELDGPIEGGTGVVFSPDGRRLLTGGRRKSVWDPATGRRLFDLGGEGPPADDDYYMRLRGRWAAFSRDGRRVVTTDGPAGRTVPTVWDAAGGQPLATLRGHQNRVVCVTFSANGRWVVTCSIRGTVRVWDADTGVEYRTLRPTYGTFHPVRADLSPDGRWVLSGNDHAQGTGSYVSRVPLDPLPDALARCPRELTAEERERFAAPALVRPGLPLEPLPPGLAFLKERAAYFAEGGLWAKAATDLAGAADLDFADTDTLRDLALACLGVGDAAGYRRACAAATPVWSGRDNYGERMRVADVLLLGSHDPTATLGRAEQDSQAWFARNYKEGNPLGAALYRAGQVGRAVEQLRAETEAYKDLGDPIKALFLAMALHDSGDAKEAATWFDRANQRWKKSDRKGGWQERLAYDLLLREAEARLRGGKK